jgi:proline iminopeptidase
MGDPGGVVGVTLGLAYPEAHPGRVIAAVFNSVTITRLGDTRWLYHEVGRLYTNQFAQLGSAHHPRTFR